MRAMLYPLLIVALAAPVAAQEFNVLGAANMKHKTQDEVDAEKQRNDDYSSAMKKMPDQNVKSDPWGNMRSGAQTGQKNAGQKQAAPKQASQKQADQKQKQTGAQ